MKVLSIAIPSYNSEEYLRQAVDSLLPGGDRVEILIVDDGSKDNTLAIAKEYEKKYPGIVKAIHQENGGHGEAVNTGLQNASAHYFKVVDSDDWVEEKSLLTILDKLEEFINSDETLDMMLSNYVYERVLLGKQKVMSYENVFPQNQVFGWDDVKHFRQSQYILMHSVIYRTELLKKCGLKLPKHTFYVDNIFVFQPLPYVKTMYYLDVDFYRYFIGREDQSVNEDVMIRRIDQQLRVTKIMINAYLNDQDNNEKLQKYRIKYLTMMMTICTVFLVKENTEESLEKKDLIWEYLKDADEELYNQVRKTLLGRAMNRNSKIGRFIIIKGYRVSQKIFGFN